MSISRRYVFVIAQALFTYANHEFRYSWEVLPSWVLWKTTT
jgi:hypothetical protein